MTQKKARVLGSTQSAVITNNCFSHKARSATKQTNVRNCTNMSKNSEKQTCP